MPIYVYRCQRCQHKAEVLTFRVGGGTPECEVCGGEMQAVIQPTAFKLMGPGFYATDYRATAEAYSPDFDD